MGVCSSRAEFEPPKTSKGVPLERDYIRQITQHYPVVLFTKPGDEPSRLALALLTELGYPPHIEELDLDRKIHPRSIDEEDAVKEESNEQKEPPLPPASTEVPAGPGEGSASTSASQQRSKGATTAPLPPTDDAINVAAAAAAPPHEPSVRTLDSKQLMFQLGRLTGRFTLPIAFVGAQHVGGYDGLLRLHRAGALVPRLKAAVEGTSEPLPSPPKRRRSTLAAHVRLMSAFRRPSAQAAGLQAAAKPASAARQTSAPENGLATLKEDLGEGEGGGLEGGPAWDANASLLPTAANGNKEGSVGSGRGEVDTLEAGEGSRSSEKISLGVESAPREASENAAGGGEDDGQAGAKAAATALEMHG